MAVEKAYKLLALQENISNNEAKSLIDSGLVYLSGKKIILARGLINTSAKFKVIKFCKSPLFFIKKVAYRWIYYCKNYWCN